MGKSNSIYNSWFICYFFYNFNENYYFCRKKKLSKEEKEEEERKKREKKALIKAGEEEDDFDTAEAMNKQMMIMMPIMAVSVAAIAPLGLALYWLVNNITTTIQRIILTKVMKSKEDGENE